MKTVAFFSEKGGVGKTTVALHLAVAAAETGLRVGLIDADPTGGLAASVGLETFRPRGLWGVVERGWEAAAEDWVRTTVPGLEILPTGALSAAEVDSLEVPAARGDAVASFLAAHEGRFDLVLVDTSPGLRGMTKGVLKAVQGVVVLVQAEPLALRALPRALEALEELRQKGLGPDLYGVLLTMTEFRSRTSLDVVQEVWSSVPGELVFESYIPRDRRIPEAQGASVPLSHYLTGRHPVSRAFQSVAEELLERLGFEAGMEEVRVRPFLG